MSWLLRTRRSAFVVAEDELVNGAARCSGFAGASRATKPCAFSDQRSRKSQRFAQERRTIEFRYYAVAAVALLVRELVGALRGVEVGAEYKQALREILVSLKLKEACAVAAAAPGPFAVMLVALVGDHV